METWEEFVANSDLDLSEFDLDREDAIIRRVGKQWCVFSEGGKRMGCYNSRKGAEKRLKQIEMFKHMKNGTETARQLCYCRECGAEYFARDACYEARCPVCGDPDSSIELTGIL